MRTARLHHLLWIGLFLLLQGCALGQILDVPDQDQLSQVEKSRTFPKSYDDVWASITKSFVTHGVSIQNQDKSSGNISTDWILQKEAIGVFTTGSRVRLNVLLEKRAPSATQVTVIPTFEIRVADKAHWQPTQRKRNQLAIEKKLFDAIQANL